MTERTPFREALRRAYEWGQVAERLHGTAGKRDTLARIAADYPIEDNARECHAFLERFVSEDDEWDGMDWTGEAEGLLASEEGGRT